MAVDRFGRTTALLCLAMGCSDPAIDIHVSQKNLDVSGSSIAVRVSDHYNGAELVAQDLEVEADDGSGNYVPVAVRIDDEATLEVVLVADNSGSQKAVEEMIRKAAGTFSDRILQMGDHAEVGLVRVSTQAEVVSEMSDNQAQLHRAVQNGLYVSNGWSALYDGIRLANEVLERAYDPAEGTPCVTPVFRGIVVFTNGEDNNSADQHRTIRAGDGIDTTLDMLRRLEVQGTPTPIFSVGVGKGVDEPMLSGLAKDTGGIYTAITGYTRLETALDEAAHRVWNAKLVCLPPADSMSSTGEYERVRVRVKAHTELGTGTATIDLDFSAR